MQRGTARLYLHSRHTAMTEKTRRKEEPLGRFESFYRDNTTPEAVTRGYENWAQDGLYDADFEDLNHRGHLMVGELLEELYPTKKKEVYILDIAAGTGRVGQEIQRRGFTRVDALDACEPMLELARKKNVYQKLINARIGGEPLDIPDETYDALTCCAAFVEGHLPADALEDLLRLVKKDGVIVMVGNAFYWDTIPEYRDKMAQVMQNLEQEKKMKTKKRDIQEGYIGDKYKAIAFVLQKL